MNNSTDKAGMRERHLARKRDNPLFPPDVRSVDERDLDHARNEDRHRLERFRERFNDQLEKALTLSSNAPSETVLALKEALDESFQISCTLPGEVEEIQTAIRKMIGAIMEAIKRGAGDDAYAQRQLRDEETARQVHFQLQQVPLIADLTAADSPIAEQELIPTLLSEAPAVLYQVLEIFDEEQLDMLLQQASDFLSQVDPDARQKTAWANLDVIRSRLEARSAAVGRPN
jgi:hypothetical protein